MKKANGLTKRVVAILLSSMLTVGTFPGNAIASEVQENTVQEEEAITTYAVTLDANGGYFENEWDDVLGEYIESTEILNKRIPVGGTVSTFPVKEQENVIVTFKGWSIERDGEIVSQGNEEYAPIENCVLYAVWNVGEHSDTSTEDEVWEDTNNQDEESFGASANQNEASKIGTTQGSEDTSSEDGNAEEDLSVGDYNVLELEEDEKETLGQQDDTPYQETINAAKNEQEESVREDASMGVVKSGTCGTNLTWILDGNGILTISSSENVIDSMEIPNNVFKGFESIHKVIILEGVEVIGISAFEQCINLKEVHLPSSLIKIGRSAFANCCSLSSIDFPDGLKTIEDDAFYSCIALKKIVFPNTLEDAVSAFDGSGVETVEFKEGTKTIAPGVMQGADELKKIVFPNGVTKIGMEAFSGCISLTEIIIPSGVKEIEERAFECCEKLTSVSIPDGITCISYGLFSNCVNLTTVNIPDSVVEIKGFSFGNCSNLLDVHLSNNLRKMGMEVFTDCNALKRIVIPKTLEDAGLAFNGSGIETVEFKEGTKTIAPGVMQGAEELNSIVFPNGVTKIGQQAFEGCNGLTDIVIPSGLIEIGDLAFDNCKNLKTVSIPSSVTTIGGGSFGACDILKIIYFLGHAPEIESDAFYDDIATAYYPADDLTWTDAKKIGYGGKITWKVAMATIDNYFVIGRDSNRFSHSNIGSAVYESGRIGEAYPTSLYYYGKLLDGLSFTEELALLDYMYKESGWGDLVKVWQFRWEWHI